MGPWRADEREGKYVPVPTTRKSYARNALPAACAVVRALPLHCLPTPSSTARSRSWREDGRPRGAMLDLFALSASSFSAAAKVAFFVRRPRAG